MHTHLKKVYYHDTDCGGVVYYANYLKYFEEARCEFLLERGIDLNVCAQKGFMFVVRRAEIDYKGPCRYGEELRIVSKLEKLGSASVVFAQELHNGGKVCVKALITLVCVDLSVKPIQIPVEVKAVFAE